MDPRFTPIDLAAERLLRDLLKQAESLRAEVQIAVSQVEKLRADYESLRELASTLTVERQSPIPPLGQPT